MLRTFNDSLLNAHVDANIEACKLVEARAKYTTGEHNDGVKIFIKQKNNISYSAR